MLIELIDRDGNMAGYLRSQEVAMIRYVPSEDDYNVTLRGVQEAMVVDRRTGQAIIDALESEPDHSKMLRDITTRFGTGVDDIIGRSDKGR